MKNYLIGLFFLSFATSAFATVYIDPSIRPCDSEIESNWLYTPTPVEAPGTSKMPFRCEGNVKVFEVTAGIVMSTFDRSYEPGPIYTWGYNGSNPGPVMEFLEGEKIKIIFKNELPEQTTLHYHGLELPFNQDGAAGHSQLSVKPGESFIYEFQINQSGTFMYHSGENIAKQLSLGLVGFMISHPKKIPETMVDHDFLYFLQMYSVPPHSIFPDIMEMVAFNYFTFNGLSSPYTPSPLVYVGQKARIRFANMSMMEHPVHLHGHTWRVVATGAGDNPASTQTYGNTILVPTAQTMDVIIDKIDEPGEWMFHCHLPHHVTNNMDVDTIPGEPMYMGSGGMNTSFKVYRGVNDPGYVNPNETQDGGMDGMPGMGQAGGTQGGGHGGGHGGMNAPKMTTYDGQIKLSNGTRLEMSLELYKAQEGKEWRKAMAFIKLYLNKDEFMVFHYDQVKYNFETGIMSIESDDRSVTLSNLTYMEMDDGGMLSGDASVDFGAFKGEVSLNARDPELREMRLRNDLSLSGEYEASCNNKKENLQLITARSLVGIDGDTNNPLASFGIYGTLGTVERMGVQVNSSVTEGFYNPFKGSLRLQTDTAGNRSSLVCDTLLKVNKVTGLKCDNGCEYVRKSTISSGIVPVEDAPEFIKDNSSVINELTDSIDVGGDFKGALKLSKSNSLIPMNLKIVSKRYATNSMVITKNMISGVVELDVSDKGSMSYKLKERSFLDSSSVINDGKNLLLLETTKKLSLIVTKWSTGMIYGEAYHEDFGLLGEFATKRNAKSFKEVLVQKETAKVLSKLDGSFSNNDWKLELSAVEIEDGEGPGIFSPLHLKGRLVSKSGAMTVNFITGSYDYVLGTFYLKSDDDRILKGTINGDKVELYLISKPVRRSSYMNLSTSKIQLMRNLK